MSYYYIYVLLSDKTGKWYTGYTHDLRKRIDEHNSGFCRSTKHGCPWKLIYYEACLIKEDAIARENILNLAWEKDTSKIG
jgi:putative endonuclease